jgi:hypothetical protein
MAKPARKVMFLVAVKRGKKTLHYWQPSATMRAAGAKPQRLSDDPRRAAIEAKAINSGRAGSKQPIEAGAPYKTRRRKNEHRGVYVVSAPSGHVKIGITDKPQSRLATLQNGTPEPLRLVFFIHAMGRAADDIEALAHRRLQFWRRSGEWFKCSPEQAIKVVMDAWAARPLSTESLNTAPVEEFESLKGSGAVLDDASLSD